MGPLAIHSRVRRFFCRARAWMQHGASTVFRFIQHLERDQPEQPVSPAPPKITVPSARHEACLLVQRSDDLASG